jgi:hypothetical protein
MKKIVLVRLVMAFTLLAMQTACSDQDKKTNDTKTIAAAPVDTLKIYLEAKKMGIKAFSMLQPGYYDSSVARYNNCITYLNKALQSNNNKGLYLYAAEFIEVNQGLEAIYDSLNQPENAVRNAMECVKWARLLHDYSQQIKFDINVAGKLNTLAKSTTTDTAKKGSLGREALQYAIAGGRVIDSLRTNDMEDLRYEDFQLTSKIYSTLGNKEEAHIYDKKYRDVYSKIYGKQPEGK